MYKILCIELKLVQNPLQDCRSASTWMHRRMQRLQDERIHLEGVLAYERSLLAQQQADNIALRQQLQHQQVQLQQLQSPLGVGLAVAAEGAEIHQPANAWPACDGEVAVLHSQLNACADNALMQQAGCLLRQQQLRSLDPPYRQQRAAKAAHLRWEDAQSAILMHALGLKRPTACAAVHHREDRPLDIDMSTMREGPLAGQQGQLEAELDVVRSELEAVREELMTARMQVCWSAILC